jgi:cellulose biosynthesis protein BcsQ
MASDMMLIVTEYSKFSIQGVKILMSVFDGMQGKVASKLQHSPRAILFTMFQNTASFRALTNAIEKQTHLGLFLSTKIPRSVEVNKASYEGVPVSSKKNKVAQAYKELALSMIDFVEKGKIYNSQYSIKLQKNG